MAAATFSLNPKRDVVGIEDGTKLCRCVSQVCVRCKQYERPALAGSQKLCQGRGKLCRIARIRWFCYVGRNINRGLLSKVKRRFNSHSANVQASILAVIRKIRRWQFAKSEAIQNVVKGFFNCQGGRTHYGG